MGIIIGQDTTVLVQGITGRQGRFHTAQMLAYGTKVAAGVSPGKGGQEVQGVPVYETVAEALEHHPITATIIFIPAPGVKDAAFEAITAGLKTIVIITEHVPLQDELDIMGYAEKNQVTIIGPNTFGIISPGKSKIGIMPNSIFAPGSVGVVARSGTLSYEIAYNLTLNEIGQTSVVGLGGDRVVGLSFIDILQKFEQDPETRAIVLVGEIGGSTEEEAALYIEKMTKPVVAFLAGSSAPPGKRMGHAGAIIERGRGTYQSKVEALSNAGAKIAYLPWQVPQLIKEILK